MFSAFRSVLKHAVKIGSPRFRRRVIDILPIKALHALKDISDTINKRCEEIFLVKKALLESGDQNMVHQVGEGKDLMSLLCTLTLLNCCR